MKIRGLHEEDGKKKAERRTFRVRHRSFGISRLHSSLLYSFDRCLYGCPEGGFDKLYAHAWPYTFVTQYSPRFEGTENAKEKEKIDCQYRLFVKKDSIEIQREEEVRARVRRMKGKVTLAERPSQWKPLYVTKVPRIWILKGRYSSHVNVQRSTSEHTPRSR